MKLHRVALCNLNSLYGEHRVGFDTDLGDAPLFLVVGQTGAGKSTIMDAISLALFGETPRLDERRGDDNADARQIISRGEKEAWAEVVFSTQAVGQPRRYHRARWVCRRRRDVPGKLDGNVYRGIVEVSYPDCTPLGDEVYDSKAKTYDPAFERALEGMSVDEFRRSMLLAQGDFAALLKAKDDERAAILERLTQTGHYKEIGRRAAERATRARAALEAVQARIGAVEVLDDEARAALEAACVAAVDEVEAAGRLREAAAANTAWLRNGALLEAQRSVVGAAVEAAVEALAELDPLRERVGLAERVAPAVQARALRDEAAVQAATRRADADAAGAALLGRRAALPALDESEKARAADREAAVRALEVATPRLDAAQSLLGQVPAVLRAGELAKKAANDMVAHDTETARLQAALAGKVGAGEQTRGAVVQAAEALAAADRSLAEHLADGVDAAGALAACADATRNAATRLERLRAVGALFDDASAKRRDAEAVTIRRSAEAAKRIELAATLDAAEGDATAADGEAARIEALLPGLRLASDLAQKRAALRAGEPCLLCGATEHPHAHHPAAGVAADHAAHEAALKTAQAARAAAAKRASQGERALAACDATLTELGEQLARAVAAQAALTERIAESLAAVECSAADAAALAAAIDAQAAALAVHEAHEKELRGAAARRDAAAASHATAVDAARKLDDEVVAARAAADAHAALRPGKVAAAAEAAAVRDEQAHAFATALRDLGAADADAAAVSAAAAGDLERAVSRALGGAPAQLRAAFMQARDRAAKAHEAAAQAHATAVAGVAAAEQTLAAATAAAETAAAALALRQDALHAALQALGIVDEDALAAASMSDAALHAARTQLAAARAAVDRAMGERDSHTAAAVAHDAARPAALADDATLDAAAAAEADAVAAEAAAQQKLGGLRAQRSADDAAHERIGALRGELDAAEQDDRLWHQMRQLIGTGDGAAFQRYAQSLNLGGLVERANMRLEHIAPRYVLVVAGDKDGMPSLSFAVEDREHANLQRPLTTLSGGETFLVSLALALALADYRQTKMPIETLLLDEGFGTLDAETLDVAMAALDRLCASGGTQIGLISHVESLRDRIGAQVEVRKLGGGRSTVRVRAGQAG